MSMDLSHLNTASSPQATSPPRVKGPRRRPWFFKRLLGKILRSSITRTGRHHENNQSRTCPDSASSEKKAGDESRKKLGIKDLHTFVLSTLSGPIPVKEGIQGKETNQGSSERAADYRKAKTASNKTGSDGMKEHGQKMLSSLKANHKSQFSFGQQAGRDIQKHDPSDGLASGDRRGLESKRDSESENVELAQKSRPVAKDIASTAKTAKNIEHVRSLASKGVTVSAKAETGAGDDLETSADQVRLGAEKKIVEVFKKAKNKGKDGHGWSVLKESVSTGSFAASSISKAGDSLSASIPASVAEANSQTASGTEMPSMVEQLAARVGRAFANGKSSVSIRLDPPELGEVNVVFSRKDGKLRVILRCSHASSIHILQQEIDSLQKRFSQMGIENAAVDLAQAEGGHEGGERFFGRQDDWGIDDGNLGGSVAQGAVDETRTVRSESALDLLA